jgi:flagellar biosynthesis GTPase FlhF
MSVTGQEPLTTDEPNLREQIAAAKQAQAADKQEPGQEPAQQPNVTENGQEPASGGENDTTAKKNREAKNLRDRLHTAEAKIAEFEQRDMTESQRLTTQNQTLEQQLTQERTARLRLEIGLSKGLTSEAMEFLQGSTQEELETSADKLKAMIGATGQAPGRPDFGAGARPNGRETDPSADFSSQIRRSAGRPA